MGKAVKVIPKKRKKTILDKIVEDKRPEIEELQDEYDLGDYIQAAMQVDDDRDFMAAVTGGERINLIAEVKKASPSAGIIREDFDPVAIAKAYEEAGASAISVITEKNHFKGNLDYLRQIRETVNLPLLRKDFIVDEYQVVESKLAGADAVLLICGLLDWRRVLSLMKLTKRLRMASLVEVHNTRELDIALIAGADLLGINNRDLETFEVDLDTTARLSCHIHDPIPIVAESGITTPEDLAQLKLSGCKAVLVGESLLRQPDVKVAIKNLFRDEWADISEA